MAITFTISNSNPADPHKPGTKWYALPSDGSPKLTVGNSYSMAKGDGDGMHVGIAQNATLAELPKLYYDRNAADAGGIGLWAHFLWPTVVAESYGGHHLIVNSYDRARFTFGFYQLAAHTPNDNLILLFRKLLLLPKAAHYFPDLSLVQGKVHRKHKDRLYSLEGVTTVHRPNGRVDDQTYSFMTYLNPDDDRVDEAEVIAAARLMHWMLNDPAALRASEAVALAIAKPKVQALANALKLQNHPVECAIWASDIRHQGRGSDEDMAAALAKPTPAARLEALYQIGSADPSWNGRRNTVRTSIQTLQAEGRFNGVTLGGPKLPF